MNKILTSTQLTNPKFIKPIALLYQQNGEEKQWEAVIAHDSVAILLYHTEKKAFILVKQLRPTVLNRGEDGMMYELCAGIIDKNKSDIEIAKEEILEECGYDVPLKSIEKITTFYTSVGISGTKQTLYFAAIDESMHRNNGGGLAEESIEVITLPLTEAKAFLFDETYKKTPGMIAAFYWFFNTQLMQTL